MIYDWRDVVSFLMIAPLCAAWCALLWFALTHMGCSI